MTSVKQLTDEQRSALAGLSMFYHEQAEAIIGGPVNMVYVIHPKHDQENPCSGIAVLSQLRGEELKKLLNSAAAKIEEAEAEEAMEKEATHETPSSHQ